MRTLIIDPVAQTISEHEYSGDWRTIAPLIDCTHYDLVQAKDGIDVFVDDEGLFKSGQMFFAIDGSTPLAGKGFVASVDEEGETIATDISIEDLLKRVVFIGDGNAARMYALVHGY